MFRFRTSLLFVAAAAALAACQAPVGGEPAASSPAEVRARQEQIERDHGRRRSVIEQERRYQMRSLGS